MLRWYQGLTTLSLWHKEMGVQIKFCLVIFGQIGCRTPFSHEQEDIQQVWVVFWSLTPRFIHWIRCSWLVWSVLKVFTETHDACEWLFFAETRRFWKNERLVLWEANTQIQICSFLEIFSAFCRHTRSNIFYHRWVLLRTLPKIGKPVYRLDIYARFSWFLGRGLTFICCFLNNILISF